MSWDMCDTVVADGGFMCSPMAPSKESIPVHPERPLPCLQTASDLVGETHGISHPAAVPCADPSPWGQASPSASFCGAGGPPPCAGPDERAQSCRRMPWRELGCSKAGSSSSLGRSRAKSPQIWTLTPHHATTAWTQKATHSRRSIPEPRGARLALCPLQPWGDPAFCRVP